MTIGWVVFDLPLGPGADGIDAPGRSRGLIDLISHGAGIVNDRTAKDRLFRIVRFCARYRAPGRRAVSCRHWGHRPQLCALLADDRRKVLSAGF